MKKVILIVLLLIVLMLVSVGLWAYFAFLYTKPLSKAELAELTPDWSAVTHGDWSPWFTEADGSQTWNPAASFNAWLATVPEEDKAWPVIIRLYHEYPDVFQGNPLIVTQVDDKRWAQGVELLDRAGAREAVDRLAQAYQRAQLGRLFCAQGDTRLLAGEIFHTYDPDEFRALKHLGHDRVELQHWAGENLPLFEERDTVVRFDLRNGRLLVAAANYSLLHNEQDRYMRLIEAAEGAARCADEYPIMINQSVRIIISKMTRDSIRWALAQPEQGFSDDELVWFDKIVRSHQQIQTQWHGDALFIHDMVRRMVELDGTLNFKTAASKLQEPGEAVSIPDEELGLVAQRVLYSTNVMLNMLLLPPEERGESSVAFDWLKTQRWKMNFQASAFVKGSTPTTEVIQGQIYKLHADALELRELIAMHRHALRYGEMPVTIEEVDSDLRPRE